MSKSPQAFRTISEVSETIDVPAHVLRFWESRFTQVKPIKRGGGRRYYRPEDIALLKVIRELLYTEGLTIRGVQKMLRETGQKALIEKFGDSALTVDDFGATHAEAPAEPETGAGLFDDTAMDIAPPPVAAENRPDANAVQRKAALKSVLSRLEALRQEMARPLDEEVHH
jgi:DNA-binding transcriptional MerR regulator